MTNIARGFALALHGGAGRLRRGEMTAEREAAYRAGPWRALTAGRDVLAAAGNAVGAVSAPVCALDDDPLFNVGRGAVFTRAGTAVREGRERHAGAVPAFERAGYFVHQPQRALTLTAWSPRHCFVP
jgi:L-asparaginase / beta-aspartyl-peptidase